jgi:hypothetical protein
MSKCSIIGATCERIGLIDSGLLSRRRTLVRLPGGNHPEGVVVEIADDTFPLDSGNSAGMDVGDDVETVCERSGAHYVDSRTCANQGLI